MALPRLRYLSAQAAELQFSQMTLKYCIVISEICFCSVALQSAAPLLNRTGFGCSSGRSKKKSWKNSFNAFNLYSFSFTFHLLLFPSSLAILSADFFIINIGFTSWLYSRNALDFSRQDPEFKFPMQATEESTLVTGENEKQFNFLSHKQGTLIISFFVFSSLGLS